MFNIKKLFHRRPKSDVYLRSFCIEQAIKMDGIKTPKLVISDAEKIYQYIKGR